jgi:adenosylcobinamide kinase / adenosylcobinamide-phosphate guanylyltransferase
MPFTVLLGGARSGKSMMSVRMASASGRPVVMVATAEPRDDEMTERIRRHRDARPESWTTVEEPLAVASAIGELGGDTCVILDCLSLWVSNLLETDATDEAITDDAEHVARTLAQRPGPGVVVSNEVGLGIVPMNALARRYRDVLGRVNAVFVENGARAYFVVAGMALPLEEPTLA